MNKHFKTFFCLMILYSIPNYAIKHIDLKQEMIGDLELIHHVFTAQYAPMDWKARYFGLDLSSELNRYKFHISSSSRLSTKQFHQLVNAFLGSTKDYHVQCRFNSTESATLPFTVQSAEGQTFITSINNDRYAANSYPIEVGDELVMFDGQPIRDVLQALQAESGLSSNPDTDSAIADISLTSRLGSRGFHVPNGPVTIQIKTKSSGELLSFVLDWDYKPEKITSPFDESQVIPKAIDPRQVLLADNMLSPYFDQQGHRLGAIHGSLPYLGKVLYEFPLEEHYFHAYLYENDKGDIVGYIRIPNYRASSNFVDDFGSIMEIFDEFAQVVVIDQMDNPGGSVLYNFSLASILAKKSLHIPLHRIAINPKEISTAFAMLELLELVQSDEDAKFVFGWGYPCTYESVQKLKNYYKFIIDEWDQGKTLTDPTPILGIDLLHPHPDYHFSKPIVLLINELDFSCGDFMPAIMQDNQRAVLLGNRTAGAGGYVLQMSYPNYTGIDYFSYTGSIAQRPNQSIIENIGVSPDVQYKITAMDLQDGYKNYIKVINDCAQSLIK